MRDQDDRNAALIFQSLKNVHDLDARAAVEIAGRLVGEHNRRIVEERARDRDALLLASRQQRVAIARALLNDPAILLADEPTGNLDSRTSIEVMDIFQRLKEERGITIILITHEPQVAEYGSRIIRFKDGRVVADQPNASRRAAAEELAAVALGSVEET